MPFPVDAFVFVRSLGRGGQVVEAARGGRYRVRVGEVLISCREDDLEEPRRTGRQRATRKAAGGKEPTASAGREAPVDRAGPRARDNGGVESVDLHGLTVEEALRKVEERLDKALRAGTERLDIIHGRGSGRVKHAVQKYLKEIGAVRRFEVAPDNPGVTRVWL